MEKPTEMDSFIGRYDIERRVVNGDNGEPDIYEGYNRETGDCVLLKIWPRNEQVDDEDLISLWQNEIRQIQQLSEYPDASNYLLTMHEAGSDADGFYLVLESDGKLPLAWHESNQPKRKTLSLGHKVRKLAWCNLARVAKGLDILHSRGLIHRNLDEGSIYTEHGNSADYQLGGFEWNIRLNSYDPTLQSKVNKNDEPEYHSFEQDWISFGKLALRIIGVDPSKVAQTPNMDDESIGKNLNESEKQLLRSLLYPSITETLDGDFINKNIDQIISEYSSMSEREVLSLNLTYIHNKIASQLSESIVDEGLTYFDITNIDSLLDFLNEDLLDAELLELRPIQQNSYRFALVGNTNTYFLEKHSEHGWQFPVLAGIFNKSFPTKSILKRKTIPQRCLRIITPRDLNKNIIGLKSQADNWDLMIDGNDSSDSQDVTKLYRDAFSLLHIIEGLQQATEIWSVTVSDSQVRSDGKYEYTLRHTEESSRERLSNALEIKPPIDRLLEAVEIPLEKNEGWAATQEGRLSVKNEFHELIYIDTINPDSVDPGFKFVCGTQFSVGEKIYLRTTNSLRGTDLMMRRRDLIQKLDEYQGLIKTLSSPLISTKNSYDEPPILSSTSLDESKERAISEIFKVLPIYLLQGPPGVGKTFLVTELIKLCFQRHPSSRVIVSAQGHDAVNNLMGRIISEFESLDENMRPLMVRSKSDRDTNTDERIQIRSQAKAIVDNLINSELFIGAPEALKEKVHALEDKFKNKEMSTSVPDKALESLIFRSANIVFSTTNSKDMSELVNSSSFFDWSIVEEAGRATGSELLAPMMLSHRRLLIGDPNQLPSFGEDRVQRLLKSPSNLKKALESAQKLLSNSFNDVSIDDLLDTLNDQDSSDTFVHVVSRMLTLFSSLHRESFAMRGSLPIAGRLEEQHRMHPDIAEMVSKIFYDSSIGTAQKCYDRENLPSPFFFKMCPELFKAPIVIVDMPFMNRHKMQWAEEKAPAHHNPSEVKVVIDILKNLRVSKKAEKPPSIAILSPYNEQVSRLRRDIYVRMSDELSHLKYFENSTECVHTIDSFQGKESDIVIISLVRNNARSWKRGLGILEDPRRMNVLLSRAKSKLIVVTSLEFLQLRFTRGKHIEKSDDLFFLKQWLEFLEAKNNSHKLDSAAVSIIPYDRLGGEQRK